MHLQDAAISLMQPRQHDDLVADGNAVQAGLNLGVQDQVRIRRTFITLPRRVGRRAERTCYPSYRADCEVDHGGVGHERHSITALALRAGREQAESVL
jgi:hypothetical protein